MTRDLADILLHAQATGTFVSPASAAPPPTLDEGYAIGAEIASRRRAQGWRPAGWKVGFTNRNIWSRWGLDHPIVAPVYRETVFRVAATGCDHHPQSVPLVTVTPGPSAALRIEVEIVFGFAATAPSAAPPDWVALGAELVDCHHPDWKLHPATSVADFGLHAGLVVGPAVAPVSSRLLQALDGVAVSLSAHGRPLAQGTGHAVLGGPRHVLTELTGPLAKHMATYTRALGRSHRHLVATGTLTPLVEARIGTMYDVEADLLPSFSFSLA